jgi:hypothetical protein
VSFGIQYYAFSLIAHLRTILKGIVMVAEAGNTPSVYILSRHVHEWTAHACYLSRKLKEYDESKQWKEAWELLSSAAMGNLWMRRHGEKYVPSDLKPVVLSEVPDPIHISKAMSAYEEHEQEVHGKRDAKDSYGLLSEYSHPNSSCLQQHHHYEDDGRTLHFVDAEDDASPLPIVNWCLIDILMFLDALLGMAKETKVRAEVVGLLKEIAAMAPKTKI